MYCIELELWVIEVSNTQPLPLLRLNSYTKNDSLSPLRNKGFSNDMPRLVKLWESSLIFLTDEGTPHERTSLSVEDFPSEYLLKAETDIS